MTFKIQFIIIATFLLTPVFVSAQTKKSQTNYLHNPNLQFNATYVTEDLTEYVNPLMGTASKPDLSNGNTYPAIALPWGMNFWTPQTGKMGDGWQYTYDADKIRGFKQTHQPSPWMNDYGQFAIMPGTGRIKTDQDDRANWFSHKTEIVKPYYYSVYLADANVTTEITPTERTARFRFTFPESDSSFIVIDALDKGSFIKIIPEKKRNYWLLHKICERKA